MIERRGIIPSPSALEGPRFPTPEQFTPLDYEIWDKVSGPDDPRIAEYVEEIITVMKMAFGRPDFPEEDMRNHIGGDLVILGWAEEVLQANGGGRERRVVAYASLQWGRLRDLVGVGNGEEQGAYLAAAVVDPAYQKQGHYRELTKRRIEAALRRGTGTIFTRTQNPKVELGIRRALEKMGISYEVERILVHAAYGEQLTSIRPMVKERAIQDEYDQLDYERGDAFVLVFSCGPFGS